MCFNECLRTLHPHWDLLKRDEEQACNDLKELGLLQAVQLYNLMYGGKALAMGITRASRTSRHGVSNLALTDNVCVRVTI